MTIIYQPEAGHRCPIGHMGTWYDVRADDAGHRRLAMIHQDDAPGTVRACTECGRTWVAYRTVDMFATRWAREGWFARWRRQRRERRAA